MMELSKDTGAGATNVLTSCSLVAAGLAAGCTAAGAGAAALDGACAGVAGFCGDCVGAAVAGAVATGVVGAGVLLQPNKTARHSPITP